ncbi:MAG: ATP-grasp domain-containing protein [Acidimicrobiia bacterium]
MARVLVVLPTSSYRTADFVAAAASLGVELAIASEENPPLDMGDRFVRIDCHDPEVAAQAIVDLADRTPVDAVVAADEAGVVIASLASQSLGLDHHPPEAARATRDKLEMRKLLAAAEVPQPRFVPVGDQPEDAVRVGFPLILKPRTATASQGVIRVDDPAALERAVERVRAIARRQGEDGPLLAESYLDGTEAALEGLVVKGDLTVLAVFDKPDAPSGPTFEETLLVTPSGQPRTVLAELERVVEAGVKALGLTHGPIHAEARIDPEGRVHLLEIAARSIGGLCGRSLHFGLAGTSLEEMILATALGAPTRASRQPRPAGVLMLPVIRSGIFGGMDGVPAARRVPGITEIDITVPPGTEVRSLPEGDRYLGFVFAVGDTTDQVIDRLHRAAHHLQPRIT